MSLSPQNQYAILALYALPDPLVEPGDAADEHAASEPVRARAHSPALSLAGLLRGSIRDAERVSSGLRRLCGRIRSSFCLPSNRHVSKRPGKVEHAGWSQPTCAASEQRRRLVTLIHLS